MFVVAISSGSLAEHVKMEPNSILPLIFYNLSSYLTDTITECICVLLRPNILYLAPIHLDKENHSLFSFSA